MSTNKPSAIARIAESNRPDYPMTVKALALTVDAADVKVLADRIVPAWPQDCNPTEALEVARLALAYGLDPFLGELIPYQHKPYLTFDGRIRIADNHPAYDGYEHGPVTGDELKAFRPKDGEVIWKCIVYRTDRSHPTIAYSRAGGPHDKNFIAKNDPVTIAQKRAIHRALRAAFPVPIPGEIGRDGDPFDPPATPDQIKAIHAVDEDAGITVTERHDALEAQYGVSRSNELTSGQASTYIDQRKSQASAHPAPEINDTRPLPKAAADHWTKAIEQAATTVALDRIWESMVRNQRTTPDLEQAKYERWGVLALMELAARLNASTDDIRYAMTEAGFTHYSDVRTRDDLGQVEAMFFGDLDAREAEAKDVDPETGEIRTAQHAG